MLDSLLEKDKAKEMTLRDKAFERKRRENNFKKLEIKALSDKNVKLEQEISYLKKESKILTTVETYLPYRIKQLLETGDSRYEFAILELKKLADALEYERKKIEGLEYDRDFDE